MEIAFNCHDYTEETKVKVAPTEFTGYALSWWDQLTLARKRVGDYPVETWTQMKKIMRNRFVPSHHHRELHQRLRNLVQGNRSVEEYFKEMETLMIRADIKEDPEATMSRFMGGLNRDISDRLEVQNYEDLEEMMHKAVMFEKQLKRRNLKPIYSSARFSPAKEEKQSKEYRPFSKPKNEELPLKGIDKGSSTKAREIQCFKCKGYGHYSNACTNKRTIVILASGEIESEGDNSEAESIEEHVAEAVVGQLLVTTKDKPYKLQWLNDEKELEVKNQVMVHYTNECTNEKAVTNPDNGDIISEEEEVDSDLTTEHLDLPAKGELWEIQDDSHLVAMDEEVQQEQIIQSECIIQEEVSKDIEASFPVENGDDKATAQPRRWLYNCSELGNPGSELRLLSNPKKSEEVEFIFGDSAFEKPAKCAKVLILEFLRSNEREEFADFKRKNVEYFLDFGDKGMKRDDELKTTFKKRSKLFEWLVMIFGSSNTPSNFKRLKNQKLHNFAGKFVVVYTENILLYNKNVEKYSNRLRKVYEDYGVLGDENSVDESKEKAMRSWLIPSEELDKRSSQGFGSFDRRFVQNLNTIMTPIYFDQVLEVELKASRDGIGAALGQDQRPNAMVQTETFPLVSNDSMTVLTHLSSAKGVEKISGTKETIIEQDEALKTKEFLNQNESHRDMTHKLNGIATRDNGDYIISKENKQKPCKCPIKTLLIKEEPPDAQQRKGEISRDFTTNDEAPPWDQIHGAPYLMLMKEEPPDLLKHFPQIHDPTNPRGKYNVSSIHPKNVEKRIRLFIACLEPNSCFKILVKEEHEMDNALIIAEACLSVYCVPVTAIIHLIFAKSVDKFAGTKEEPPDIFVRKKPIAYFRMIFEVGERVWIPMIDGSFHLTRRIINNAHRLDLRGKSSMMLLFDGSNLVLFVAGQTDLRTNPFQLGEDDVILGSTKELEEEMEAYEDEEIQQGAKDALEQLEPEQLVAEEAKKTWISSTTTFDPGILKRNLNTIQGSLVCANPTTLVVIQAT